MLNESEIHDIIVSFNRIIHNLAGNKKIPRSLVDQLIRAGANISHYYEEGTTGGFVSQQVGGYFNARAAVNECVICFDQLVRDQLVDNTTIATFDQYADVLYKNFTELIEKVRQ